MSRMNKTIFDKNAYCGFLHNWLIYSKNKSLIYKTLNKKSFFNYKAKKF